MKACAHCGGAMADAAARCPACGYVEGARLLDGAGRDEPIGFRRDPLVLAAILLFLGLFCWAALAWFLG